MLPEPVNAVLCVAVLVSATLCVAGALRDRKILVYVFKPFTMLLILALAVQPSVTTPSSYRALVVAGLVFSLAGDVFLMLPRDRFTAGLASFLVAHVLYVVAFATDGPITALVPWALVGVAYYALLYPTLGRTRGPVAVYVVAIVAMAWQATARWIAADQFGALLSMIGAGLFVFSDAVLAWNRFRHPFATVQAVVLPTYFVGQCLIALSVGTGNALVEWAVG